ncbi:hypothetical protein BCR33DRAFT_843898, partial [Rhizoclosmatium globosum]
MFARGWQAELIEHCLNVFDDECIIPVAQITASVPFSIISQIQFEGAADRKLKTSLTTGSQFRHIGQGLRVVNVPITLFNDDTSGNSSKKWNKFESWSFTLAGLPFKESQLQENINFICTSKYVSAVESGTVIAMSLRTLRNGIKVYDSVLREDIIIIVEVLQVLGDNPAQSTIVSHIGHRSKHPCRMCNCPGDCYEPHTFERTKNLLLNTKQQLLNKVIDSKTALKSLAENGISDKFFAKFAENHFSTPSMNPFLGTKNERPYFSGAADAPVEVLHCVLLGVVKHTARATIPVNNKAAQSLKGVIEGLSQDCLKTKIQGHSVVQYVKSLNGKDFRSLIQLAPFAFYHVCDETELKLWTSLADLTAHIYGNAIFDLDSYTSDLNCYLDIFVLNASQSKHFRDLATVKLHLLRHLPWQVDQYGLPAFSATEIFESFNKIIRSGVLHSSRLDASKDV